MSAHLAMLERLAAFIDSQSTDDHAVLEDLANLREHIRSCRQIDAEEPISVFVWGQIWDPSAGNCFLAVTAPPTLSFTREAIADWLRENARDFRNVVDFRALKGDAEIGWADEAAGAECERACVGLPFQFEPE